ncbi:generative cell specific-1 [Trypanosoma theileri]|uniref:Generative cell specific-1 n=1 Tax=Trypanosoma theileri TaxID=67003 RepID=A0A1X0P0J5_9TRYP|nr:generative cell specific-1 [Trypanosoma theileri]ORC90464.1 generative cell specific-1 [Trypanosoma theileri]
MFSFTKFFLTLLVTHLTIIFPSRADALLVASSSIEYCERGSVTEAFPCEKKMIVTLSVESGQLEGVEEVVLVREAVDKTSSGGNANVMFEPVRLTTRKSRVQYRYPVFYERNFNAQPYERQVTTNFFEGCKDTPGETSTCGDVLDTSGNSIPYSQGFCCTCGVCQLAGVCPSDSRSVQTCSLFGAVGMASCLRFGDMWYSGYNVGSSLGWYHIQVGLSNTDKNTTNKKETILELGPDKLLSSSPEFGALARIVGDFMPSELPLDLGGKMLFIPTLPKMHARVLAGPAEWILLDKNRVTVDGRECNKVGVSYEGFAGQGNRCDMYRGSCLAGQLESYRQSDLEQEAKGGKGEYMVRFLGDFDLTPGANGTSPYIAYWVKGSFSTMITVTISADKLQYLVSVSPGKIVAAGVTNDTIGASTRDGVLTVRVRNTGTLTAQYTLSVGNCTTDVHPMIGQTLSLKPEEEVTRHFDLFIEDTSSEGKKECGVALQDARGTVVDTKIVEFHVTPVGWTNGTQGGSAPSDGGVAVDGGRSSVCSSCSWYNLFCFVKNGCLWQPFIYVVIGVAIILLVYILQKYCMCCSTTHRKEAHPHEPVAVPQVVVQRGVSPYASFMHTSP